MNSYEKHYNKGQEQRLTESNLDEIIANYFKIVSQYIIITKSKNNFSTNFDNIFNYQHPKSGNFENCNTKQELITELHLQEKNLNNEYKKFLKLFQDIQSDMV